ncbi:cryptochrome/photolyase family protein [Daejeonella oryzae]|uniref:cryptochrome/photolyase family protein n=1 Tax=Daejeonella oryzae TaxID=1122943 RepID=UPI000413050C|nr:deoxyribodipyrimidine photo-lyase [Daejeonella oryzae]
MTREINIFWFRRDLRLNDNAGLFHALKSGIPVLPVFIFDRNILSKLEDKNDARVSFIHLCLQNLNTELEKSGSSLYVKHDSAENAWKEIIKEFNVKNIYCNHDYEPYARKRDSTLLEFFENQNIGFHTFKDQVIFEKSEIVKDDQKPYTVFTPYKRKWLEKINEFYLKPYPSQKYFDNFYKDLTFQIPSLENLGFEKSTISYPDKSYSEIIERYKETRNFPAIKGTSRISVHLRFGTISIRELAAKATEASEKTWLNELIWRDFYAMILWHFPYTVDAAFKSQYDQIEWRNNAEEFKAWCEGKTGYPIVDAGMRELNSTGFMHNRVRMITASFLTKHLLIDWRWGEAYFARKLLDYDQASNVGGWQWAAGSGNDAAPYFRVFSPELQTKKFDPKLEYIKKWIPEFDDPFKYPQPIVDHKFARERVLRVFKQALSK